jgi:S-adenosyl methyltransferase
VATGSFDPAVANSARIYDYWPGGKDNFAADREPAKHAIAANPGIVADVRANRAFLPRVVRCPEPGTRCPSTRCAGSRACRHSGAAHFRNARNFP